MSYEPSNYFALRRLRGDKPVPTLTHQLPPTRDASDGQA